MEASAEGEPCHRRRGRRRKLIDGDSTREMSSSTTNEMLASEMLRNLPSPHARPSFTSNSTSCSRREGHLPSSGSKNKTKGARRRGRIGATVSTTFAFVAALSVAVVDAQPRPPGKVTSVAASERVLEGVKLSNPASSDNLALIKFRDGLQTVLSTDDAAFRAVWTPRAPAPTSACDPTRSSSPWPGVTCVDGRVVALSLSGRGLEGTASPELARLSKLAKLDLSNNTLLGSLPTEWGALSELTEVNVARNRFSGELPASWGGMRKLKKVDLSSNSLRGSLPAVWGAAWTNATSLDLSNNGQLSGELPHGWRGLSSMRELNLSGNRLVGTLPGDWASTPAFSQLNSIDLSSNALEGSIPQSWVSSPSFPLASEIRLDKNCFGGRLPEVTGDVGTDAKIFLWPQRANECPSGSRAGLCGAVPVGLRAYDASNGESLLQAGPSCDRVGGGEIDAPLRGRLRLGAGVGVIVALVVVTAVATWTIIARATRRRERREELIAEIKARRGSGASYASSSGGGFGDGSGSRENRTPRRASHGSAASSDGGGDGGGGGALVGNGQRHQQQEKPFSLLQPRYSSGNGINGKPGVRVPATVDEEMGTGTVGGGGSGGKGGSRGSFSGADPEVSSGLAPISPWAVPGGAAASAPPSSSGGGDDERGRDASTRASATNDASTKGMMEEFEKPFSAQLRDNYSFEGTDPAASSMLGFASPWAQDAPGAPPSASESDSAPTPTPPSTSTSAGDGRGGASEDDGSSVPFPTLERGRPSNTASAPDATRGASFLAPTVSGASSGSGAGGAAAAAAAAAATATATTAAVDAEDDQEEGDESLDGVHRVLTSRAKKTLARLKTWS